LVNDRLQPDFWRGKRVFLTGHTGFKGSWLTLWLSELGAEIKGYALAPETSPNLFEVADVQQKLDSEIGDIGDLTTLTQSLQTFNPDILIHLAAQPLVGRSYQQPVSTYATNIMGTVHLLEAARGCSHLKAIVNVTTDKCYENKEWDWGYRETEAMGGYDPYSSSKGCSELITAAYRRSFLQQQGIGVATARAGNVIGGGDWTPGRLIPDILSAFENKIPVVVRSPQSIRPWQHVLEPLSGYLILAEKLYQQPERYAESWNFGPYEQDARPVSWILDYMVNHWGQEASWTVDSNPYPHEAQYLKLDISKARSRLNWQPVWSLECTLKRIMQWQQAWLSQKSMQSLCLQDIKVFTRQNVLSK